MVLRSSGLASLMGRLISIASAHGPRGPAAVARVRANGPGHTWCGCYRPEDFPVLGSGAASVLVAALAIGLPMADLAAAVIASGRLVLWRLRRFGARFDAAAHGH
jgi:hypothetical protein